jgi:hypothetical protein
MTNSEELKRLARQGYDLKSYLYNESMTAAIHGDAELSERYKRLSDIAFKRYERRYNAHRRSISGDP